MNSEFPPAPFQVIANDAACEGLEDQEEQAREQARRSQAVQIALSWLLVGIPLAYGFYETLLRAAKLFTG
ncbi:hypothetical protein LVJ94_25125 [Pendulispora rubella]|uniref:Uncharacterized protein n=1 Tax=Pendulispora rubella TaxID=2741070 RepID=A0ABZ2LNL6_9BACT